MPQLLITSLGTVMQVQRAAGEMSVPKVVNFAW